MAFASSLPAVSCGSLLIFVGLMLLPEVTLGQDYAAKGFKLAVPSPHVAAPEDVEAGKALYQERCSQCHGEAGDGGGVMADRLDPRPRDFRRGVYKIRTTTQGELPTDMDLFRIVSKGMPGTSMPAWRDHLSDDQIWQLAHYQRGMAGSASVH